MPVRPIRNLVGRRFGKLVVQRTGIKHNKLAWICHCDCGNTAYVREANLIGGNTNSCGCLRAEANKSRARKHERPIGPEYITWRNMKTRMNSTDGGRVPYFVDPTWLESYEKFYDDVGPRPGPTYKLCRVAPKLGFTKDNCVWKDPKRVDRRESDS